MAKDRRNKKYRPKGIAKFGGLTAIAGHMIQREPLPEGQRTSIMTDYFTALEAMTNGAGERRHFEVFVYAVNVGMILAENVFNEEHDELIGPALQAVQRMKERHIASGRYGLDGAGLQALRDYAPLYEAEIEQATSAEVEAAIKEMHRRIAVGNVVQKADAM